MYDVSAVTYPAYEEASVGLRSLNIYKEKLEEGVNKDKKENETEQLNSWNKSLAARKLKIVKLK